MFNDIINLEEPRSKAGKLRGVSMAISSINNALLSLQTSLNKLAVTSSNISNTNTYGYKSKKTASTGNETKYMNINLNTSIGILRSTNGPLDVAINGDGYFRIELGNDLYGYTRDGNFSTDANGNLVTSSGYRVYPQINIPMDALNVTIEKNGTVSANMRGGGIKILGQIQTATFSNQDGLESFGDNILTETVDSGAPIISYPGTRGHGNLISGYIEGSNVNFADETVNSIIEQHTIEANIETIKTSDEILGELVDLKS